MNIFSFLNPQKWIGQIVVILGFLSIGAMLGYMLKERINPCPPTTQITLDQKIKAKKNSQVQSDLNALNNLDCEEWLKGLSNKEVRNIRK